MKPWVLLDRADVPGTGEALLLYRRGDDHVIRLGSRELMSSRPHGSEREVARLACQRIRERPRACVVIGGLGMGYTLRAALDELGPDALVEQAELIPAVVQWQREIVGHHAGHPLDDPRVVVREGDVVDMIERDAARFDAIVLDVDNGPEAMVVPGNARLHERAFLAATCHAMRPGSVLALWSASGDAAFARRLRDVGFGVEEIAVGVGARARGVRHMVFLATRPDSRTRP